MISIGEKLYTLRKNKSISQEEFAEIIGTSRQAVSKWERDESFPDIEKVVLIAQYYNISIDYLLGHSIDSLEINEFIEKLETTTNKKSFDIGLDEIKRISLKNENNYKLNLTIAMYLHLYGTECYNQDILNNAIKYFKKTLALMDYNAESKEERRIIQKNIIETYFLLGEYETAEFYIKQYDPNDKLVLMGQCQYSLKNYEESIKLLSQNFLLSATNIINGSQFQVLNLICKMKIKDAYSLLMWLIDFIESISKENSVFLDLLVIEKILQAFLEKIQKLEYKNTIYAINNIIHNRLQLADSTTESLKFYYDKKESLFSNAKNVNLLVESFLEQIKNINTSYYNDLKEVYEYYKESIEYE